MGGGWVYWGFYVLSFTESRIELIVRCGQLHLRWVERARLPGPGLVLSHHLLPVSCTIQGKSCNQTFSASFYSSVKRE